jgi:hypothetical protein
VGSKERHNKQFIREHPFCCFCGGLTPTAEIDHVPPRVLFDNRQWPQGYDFPACVPCNRASRHDEQIVGLLSRIYPGPTSKKQEAEFDERLRAVADNYPGLLEEMMPTAEQVKATVSEYVISSTRPDLAFLSVRGPLVNSAVANFGRKLFLALHYKHTGSILPKNGGVAILWFSNLQIQNNEIPKELAPLVSGFPDLKRSNMNLSDQFFYRFGFTEDLMASVFLTFFRRTFAILGYANAVAPDILLPQNATLLGPYQHESLTTKD